MDRHATQGVALRFQAYIEHLSGVVGHADRREPLMAYWTGLLLPGDRKSVEPMAARIALGDVGAKHQSLHHFVAKAPWDEARLLAAMREYVLPKMEKKAPIRALDCRRYRDTKGLSPPRRGRASIRSAWLASHHASLPIAFRLYLPEPWTRDEERRKKAGIPEIVAFQTKAADCS